MHVQHGGEQGGEGAPDGSDQGMESRATGQGLALDWGLLQWY